MSMPGPENALDHVVVVMFENRSFDNLLGRLSEPGEVAAFEGVAGKELSNPVPGWAGDSAGKQAVPYGVAPTMDTPNPDPRSCGTSTPSCSASWTRRTVV
jgi:phospholipase C